MDIITRAEARAQGLTHYFTGKPCKHGHIEKRLIAGTCLGCNREHNRRFREVNGENQRARARELYLENCEQIRARKRANYQARQPQERARAKAYYEANRESERARAQRFFQANPTYRRDYERRRYQEDEQWRICKILRARLSAIVKRGMGKKLGSTLELLGCSLEEFQAHIEAQWVDGMSWDNLGHVGDVWHIDHIKPCASFDLTDPAQQKACFHWSNLQPLWAADNQQKGAKLVA